MLGGKIIDRRVKNRLIGPKGPRPPLHDRPSGSHVCSANNAQAPFPARPIDRRSIYAADRRNNRRLWRGRMIPHKALRAGKIAGKLDLVP